MGDVIDFQTYRLGVDVRPIQDGIDMVAGYLGEQSPEVNASHDGYFMTADYHNGLFSVGKNGLADFNAGFRGVFETASEETLRQESAGIAYGAFSAARVLLPDVIEASPKQSAVFEKLVDAYSKRYPQAELPAIAELITAQAAAALAVIGLHKVFREQDTVCRAAFSARIRMKHFPPSHTVVASSFKHRLDEEMLLRLLDRPVRRQVRSK